MKTIQLYPNYLNKNVNQGKKDITTHIIKTTRKENYEENIGSHFLNREVCSLLRRQKRRRRKRGKERRCQMQKYRERSSSLMKMISENDVTNSWICKSYNKVIFHLINNLSMFNLISIFVIIYHNIILMKQTFLMR